MKAGSLFTGIGGIDIALEHLGFEVAWQVEIDNYCNKVLERRWPHVHRERDIRTTDFMGLERIDLIAGGFPCQPFSVAGKRRGEADERNMWPDTLRAIRECQPRYVFLENVPNLIGYAYFRTILADLVEAGYRVEDRDGRPSFGIYSAAEVGANHRRERLFILAYSERQPIREKRRRVSREHSGTGGDVDYATGGRRTWRQPDASESGELGIPATTSKNVGNAESARCTGHERALGVRQENAEPDSAGHIFPPAPNDYEGWTCLLSEMPEIEPAVCRETDGISCTLDMRTARLKALGNAVVWQQAVLAFTDLWNKIHEI